MIMGMLIHHLEQTLADTYALYLKTQNYHWNVKGPCFYELHMLFERQYEDLAQTIDSLAELIKSLDKSICVTFAWLGEKTHITSAQPLTSAQDMILDLVQGHTVLTQTLQTLAHTSVQEHDDVIENFATERLAQHRKATWMLTSSLA
jgi:starvation-inducible DNA-binding protein